MATSSQSKGFIQLEWICPNCNSRNPGPKKTCENCGAPQPANVQFLAPADAKLIQDENVAKIARAGADIHCGFCGTRNPATATVCSQCGGDLKEGKARQAGMEMQREAAGMDVKCTNCGEVNPSTRTMCSKCGAPLPRPASAVPAGAPSALGTVKPGAPAVPSAAAKRTTPWLIIGGIVACLAIVCIGAFMVLAPTKSSTATVSDIYWQTSIPVQEIQAVNYSDKSGSPPSGAYNVSCHTETNQVCTDKTVDQGNGYAEVVQECHDESTDYCSYTVDEWQTIQTYTLDGHDFSPVYSQPSLSGRQRLGSQAVTLTVYFTSGGKEYTYTPADENEFQQFTVGSTWTLQLNALGGVVSVEK
jgi:membrane protease subunit (stomatin/prohibitin family)